jgi:hypothetical protein
MEFTLQTAVPVLERTPAAVDALLRGLPDTWTAGTEGPDTWSPFDVVGHLIHADRTDWMTRVEHLLAHGDTTPFPPFDRFAQFEASRGTSLPVLLDTFTVVRADSLARLRALNLTTTDLTRPGLHGDLGRVTLGQLLATWVAHDLDHIVQISRVMGRQYTEAVGPWRQYLRIMGPA